MIELLMVIAIIGILAGILIPVVGSVKENANIAASKSQLSGYVNAINLFKGEYNYYPFAGLLDDDERLDLSDASNSQTFIETLSARTTDGSYSKTSGAGNRRQIPFYEFTESDFFQGDSTTAQIADRFNNTNIYILIDADGNGVLESVPDPENPGVTKDIRTKVSAYVQQDGANPDYYLYE
ncbi:hypothetical protein [Coraliomargarita sinensis]|uniref:hypothetical protein n=1 Tax=Coraliomargarita sinensis TaxID=2174842 RepID=UPI0018EE93C7|nr:hypothetical protein [Coraliomargarita sinensis]